ncbi:DUF6458 family protein [Sphaerisporangium sp. TRM90804]|uniref:DUF6458 family protein n=1 Tax=Sphaerisporangium sp. TRM90804 TaxID=3031113 RepID=UPI002448A068|nr:DUF6458 family protein [Sphaerisporangium sp. TRM90804]MDH2429434.1 DUF6458 family protein [Sphaerisporangium sp. TRM90804]
MGIGVSIFFLTVGAILRFAIDPDVLGDSVHIDIIGVIFMVAGAIGLTTSFFLLNRARASSEATLMEHEQNRPPTI